MTADLCESIIHLRYATALQPPRATQGGISAFQEAEFIRCRGRATGGHRLGKIIINIDRTK